MNKVAYVFASLLFLPMLTSADEADSPHPEFGPNRSSPAIGTIMNSFDYINETLDAIEARGGSRNWSMPQSKLEPGWGPIAIIPEFIGELGISAPSFFTTFDVPIIPVDTNKIESVPEVPAINRTVVGATEDGFTEPHIPPLRWTSDGRLGVESQVGGTPENPSPVSLYLLAPEKLEEPFLDSAPGPQAMVLEQIELPFSEFARGLTGAVQHTNICDPYYTDEGARQNPYACGENGADDCYDVTLIANYMRNGNTAPRMDDGSRIMGTPMHIRVSNPKTTEARIAEVTFGEPKLSKARTDVLFETITPADGRLLIARRGWTPLVWQNTRTKETHLGSYDVIYAVSSPDSEPCDVTDWSDMYPITHAPYDDRVNQRYQFAARPFRDPGGNIIPDGVDIKGTYPWMDKEAKNFSIQVGPGKLFPKYAYGKDPLSRYPVRCVDEENCSVENMADSDNSKDNIYAILGSWTQGKMVLLDGLVNPVDYRLGGSDRDHSYLSLYQPGTGLDPSDSGEKRVGSTRGGPGEVPVRDTSGEVIGTFTTGNISMFDSVENRLTYLDHMKPSTPFDVVWLVSSGVASQELAFDDYLNPDALIVSNMVGYFHHDNNRWYRMSYFDGWQQGRMAFDGQVRVQNSAASLPERWQIPQYGRVFHGRLEPVANGGVRGKGLWFDGENTRVEYEVPEQPQDVLQSDWYYGLFVEPRNADDDIERVLIRFPNNSKMTLEGLSTLRLRNSWGGEVLTLDVSDWFSTMAWTHISMQVGAVNAEGKTDHLQLFINGFPLWSSEGNYRDGRYRSYWLGDENFRPTEGEIRLGDDVHGAGKASFYGWMDEFKAFAYEPNLESVCNTAHGTLVGLTDAVDERWQNLADRFAAASHEAVSKDLALYGQQTMDEYICYHDYSGDNIAHLNSRPEGSVAIRDALHFPEGPLYHDAPRPDSSHNEFCLSCHHSDAVGGLTLAALERGTVASKHDNRRQPLQPPPRVFGNIPANWFPGAPSQALDAGEDGILIDEWIQQSMTNATPRILNIVFADSEGDGKELLLDKRYDVTSLDTEISKIRINADGLISRLRVDINGEQYELNSVPFSIDLDQLQDGENRISVEAYMDEGGVVDQYEQTVSISKP